MAIQNMRLGAPPSCDRLGVMKPIMTHGLGYSRLAEKRELESALDAYVRGEIMRPALEQVASQLRRRQWMAQAEAGLDWVPCGDFSFCDPVLDTTCLLGNIPERLGWRGPEADIDTRLTLSRGPRRPGERSPDGVSLTPRQTAPWFDTNCQYVIPEFGPESRFALASWQVIKDFNEAGLVGISAKPVLLGPLTYLSLGQVRPGVGAGFSPLTLLDEVLPIYGEVLRRLAQWGADWVQFDEPILARSLSDDQRRRLTLTYAYLKKSAPRLKLLVANYFGALGDNLDVACSLDCDGLHIDAVSAPDEVEAVVERLPPRRMLSLGIVDGRDVWVNDIEASLQTIAAVRSARLDGELWLAPSCSLRHVPVSVRQSTALDSEVQTWFASVDEKLAEVILLRDLAEGKDRREAFDANRAAWASRRRRGQAQRDPVTRGTRSTSVERHLGQDTSHQLGDGDCA